MKQMIAVLWKTIFEQEEYLIIYDFTNMKMEEYVNGKWNPNVHKWESVEALLDANYGQSATLIDKWYE